MASATPTDITALNSIRSPLLQLPGEIRNEIYGYARSDDEYLRVVFIATTNCKSEEVRYTSKMADLHIYRWNEERLGAHVSDKSFQKFILTYIPVVSDLSLDACRLFSLRAVCRQIRTEVEDNSLALYGRIAFGFFDPEALTHFVAATSIAQRHAIRQIAFPDLSNFTGLQRESGYQRGDFPAPSLLEDMFPNLKEIVLPMCGGPGDWVVNAPLNTWIDYDSGCKSYTSEEIERLNQSTGIRWNSERCIGGFTIERMDMKGVREAFDNMDRLECDLGQ
ncbi:hypothetical protein K491DRAFT_723817 [Lophiostoma macrostomum CBS 122681]|uniref:Uncharacterized protein n=1 Tax=Lophiostoma macrostomum CBS 122681 TaxID=1314788 RepID=A0A6A6SKU6_9PLEO|nr:hypothetical protein K491DRAFT_723817 [Lophiostoma macrostomum CBS 122681]